MVTRTVFARSNYCTSYAVDVHRRYRLLCQSWSTPSLKLPPSPMWMIRTTTARTAASGFWCIQGHCGQICGLLCFAPLFYASAIAHSALRDQPRRRRPRPNENCPLRMRCASSMPAIVIAVFANDLNPAIDAQRRLMARWSCSIRCSNTCSSEPSRCASTVVFLSCWHFSPSMAAQALRYRDR